MSERDFKNLGEWASESVGAMGTDTRNLVLNFSTLVLRGIARDAISNTPTGPDEAAQKRMAIGGSRNYGHMRDNWVLVDQNGKELPVSGSSVPVDLIRRVFGRKITRSTRATKVGSKGRLANDAAHSRVIEMGRKKSGKIPRRGGKKGTKQHSRTIGSSQAPRGVLRPAVDRMNATVNRVKAEAIKATERGK